jgi:hypothetical protein
MVAAWKGDTLKEVSPTPVNFYHGVEGSSPSALTNNTKHNLNFDAFGRMACVCTVSANELPPFRGGD